MLIYNIGGTVYVLNLWDSDESQGEGICKTALEMVHCGANLGIITPVSLA